MRTVQTACHSILAIALLGTFACTSSPGEPPAEFPFAAVAPECGPADGPAVSIYLVADPMDTLPPPARFVRVYVWRGPGELRGRTLTIGGDHPDGSAAHYDGTEASGEDLHGTITVTEIESDSTIVGEVDLGSDGTFTVRGSFRAHWIPQAIMCG